MEFVIKGVSFVIYGKNGIIFPNKICLMLFDQKCFTICHILISYRIWLNNSNLIVYDFCFRLFSGFFSVVAIENASRFCYANGTWGRPNYEQCKPLTIGEIDASYVEIATHIYSIGYPISLISLSLGLAVFIHFK